MLGGPELIIILLAIVVLLFGAKKIPEFARSLGKASAEFRRGKMIVEKEIREADYGEDFKGEPEVTPNKRKPKKAKSKIVKAAEELGIDVEGKSEEEIKKEIAKEIA